MLFRNSEHSLAMSYNYHPFGIFPIQEICHKIAENSPSTLNEWMQEKKCRAKKMLSYLDKHKDMFLEMIAKGIALPIYQIPTYQYSIYITTEKDVNIPEDWEQVYLYKDWFITIGTDDKLCFSSFEFFEEHRPNCFIRFMISCFMTSIFFRS